MRNSIELLVASVLVAGCGNDYQVVNNNLEAKLQWQQGPSTEIVDCHVFTLDNADPVEVDRLQVNFPSGSHHVHIYRHMDTAMEREEDRVYDCSKGLDWTKWSLLIGAQTKAMDWTLPQGVTIPLEPHQQLLAQVHWLNTTDEAITGEVDLDFHTTEYSEQHLGVVFGVNKRVNVAPASRVRVQDWCQMPEGANLIAMMGHFHERGTEYRVTERQKGETTGQVIYESPNEAAFEFKTWNPMHKVASGAGFEYGCTFTNSSGSPIGWGPDTKTQEHCNMTAYYAPAEKLSTLCLLEPSKLKSVTAQQQTVRAGEGLVFEVELAAVETTEMVITLDASDATVLQVPMSVVVPAGKTRASFTVSALRPGFAEVNASVADATVSSEVRVTGLVISEVFFESAAGGQVGQWIELANQTNKPINLSQYSIGAGKTDYMRTRVELPMYIQPGSCVVVGGPLSDESNHYPYFDLATTLTPSLGLGGAQANGVALFASPMASLNPTSRPIDTVVYGGSNTTLNGPDGQLAPVWPAAMPGGSLVRVAGNVWAKTSTPNPGNCVVYGAH
jgi:hypothetical protein